ncbi:MAG: RHS repeat domain-containing protein [Bacilli bacterium]
MTKLGQVNLTYDSRNLLKEYYKDNTNDYVFEYDYRGRRIKKIKKNSYVTKYYYDEEKLVGEVTINTNTNSIIRAYIYYYDALGICGIKYVNIDENNYLIEKDYHLVRNSLGDITKLMCEGVIVGSYSYDAWGNVEIIVDSNSDNIDRDTIYNNPFRYRGYYYDVETSLFWLSSRYYSPELCRFISPDDVSYLNLKSLNGLNLYCYCYNNPISYVDPSGHSSILVMVLIGTLFGAAVGFGFDAVKQLINNGWDFSEVDWGSAVNSAIVGGALGFSLAMGVGYLGPVIAGTAIAGGLTAGGAFAISTAVSFSAGALGYATEEWMNGRTPSFGKAMMHGGFVALEGMVNFGVGGIIGSLGNVGTKGKFLTSKEWWGKFIFGLEFTQPFKIEIDYIRKNI